MQCYKKIFYTLNDVPFRRSETIALVSTNKKLKKSLIEKEKIESRMLSLFLNCPYYTQFTMKVRLRKKKTKKKKVPNRLIIENQIRASTRNSNREEKLRIYNS